jgi:hypothetical protein
VASHAGPSQPKTYVRFAMIKEAKHGTVPEMRKQLVSMQKAFDRKEKALGNTYSGSNRHNELIRDQWAIRAEMEILESWINRETGETGEQFKRG